MNTCNNDYKNRNIDMHSVMIEHFRSCESLYYILIHHAIANCFDIDLGLKIYL